MSFPAAAREALANTQLRANLGRATRTIRDKRARVVAELPDWEELRTAGAAAKDRALMRLDTELERLEAAVDGRGREGALGGRRRRGLFDRRRASRAPTASTSWSRSSRSPPTR